MTADTPSTASTGDMSYGGIRTTLPLHKQDCVEKTQRLVSQRGDVVMIDFNLTPENGYVPHPLFDTSGVVSLVLGWGNYLPGLHTLIEGMAVGDSVNGVSIDAGWGERNPSLVVRVAKKKLRSLKDINLLKVGSQIYLEGGIQVTVTEVTRDSIVVDGNPPLAGASFACDLRVLAVDSFPQQVMEYAAEKKSQGRYKVATFALGCFWGGELAFMRTPGVVATKVGYTQGETTDPSYEEVCTGTTNHREAILVVYDSTTVSYESLIEVATERLVTTSVPFYDLDETKQYSHGVYYHTDEQRQIAEVHFDQDNKHRVEVLQARAFYNAEDYHQQYLLKGGQSAKKGNKETIRCYG